MKDITSILRPNNSSREGFLNDIESLQEVIDNDNATLAKLKITHEQIADALETIVGMARRATTIKIRSEEKNIWRVIKKGFKIYFGNHTLPLNVSYVSYAGWQYCPLCNIDFNVTYGLDFTEVDDDRFIRSDSDFTITRNSESLFFSELHVHLIRKHHFFEGHTKYRLEPERAIKILGIEPNKSYVPKYETEMVWQSQGGFSCSSYTEQDYVKELRTDKALIYSNSENKNVVGIKAKVSRRLNDELLVIMPEKNGWATFEGHPIEFGLSCCHYKLIQHRFIPFR